MTVQLISEWVSICIGIRSQFGQRFGRCNADTHRQAEPLGNPLPHVLPIFDQIAIGKAAQLKKAFIDLKERRTAMDMTSAQTFRYSISDVGCP
jgi:hypothetical protein